MSEMTLPALRDLLAADVPVTVRFEGCPYPGSLGAVHPDGTLGVDVHDEDGRYDGVHYVTPRTVTAIETG